LVARLVLTTNIRVTQGHYNLVPGRPLQEHNLSYVTVSQYNIHKQRLLIEQIEYS